MQIGWIDPTDGTERTFDEALAMAEAYGEWAGYPYEVLLGMYQQSRGDDRPDGITVTQLLGCARKVHLDQLHQFYAPPEDTYASFRGVIAHSMLEKFKPIDSEVERRVYRTYRDIPISGQVDSVRITGVPDPEQTLRNWLDYCDAAFASEQAGQKLPKPPVLPNEARFLIRDWKSKDQLPTYAYVSQQHQKQGNLYRWLLRIPKGKVDIEFVYVSMKGVRIMRLYDGGHFRNGRAKPEQIWSDTKVREFLEDRLVTLHLQDKYDRPIPYDKVPDDDLWNCKFCPARALCYRLAADEARAAWEKGEGYDRMPPREEKK